MQIGGKVVKSADQIARDHYTQNAPRAVKKTTIKTDTVDTKKAVAKPLEDDWAEPEVTKKTGPDPIIIKKEQPEVDPNFYTDADPWVEDADGNYVRASDLAERLQNESVPKSKKGKPTNTGE